LTDAPATADFRHEALLYRGDREFVEQIAPFVIDGIANGEPTLVMVSGPKIEALRDHIGAGDGLVQYRDMEVVGGNPARIIPAWDAFAVSWAQRGVARMRGVGEPIWPGRAAVHIDECHWHEALINTAFAQVQGFWLVCTYDAAGLDPGIVLEARTTHPLITHSGSPNSNQPHGTPVGFVVPTAPLASPLAEPDDVIAAMTFEARTLSELRALVGAVGARARLSPGRLDDLVLAVSEVATNSITHGGGRGVARIWMDGGDVVCEVSDRGVINDPLVDRQQPGADPSKPRGLWTANQLCDLVQLRSSRETGSVVRLLVHATLRSVMPPEARQS
jgi:anti-sigma regulatory factor (Ser/Thr protein kinase)